MNWAEDFLGEDHSAIDDTALYAAMAKADETLQLMRQVKFAISEEFRRRQADGDYQMRTNALSEDDKARIAAEYKERK